MSSPLYDLIYFSTVIDGVPRNSISGPNLLLNLNSNQYSPSVLGVVNEYENVSRAKTNASALWVKSYSNLPGLEDVTKATVPELDFAVVPLLHSFSHVTAVLSRRREQGGCSVNARSQIIFEDQNSDLKIMRQFS